MTIDDSYNCTNKNKIMDSKVERPIPNIVRNISELLMAMLLFAIYFENGYLENR